eukprot:NODE_6957_length_1621_cov_13.890228.p1 GENE.NODE_6957_length_1621_cov_13.890228~~NODE_6957_length_1621_cov_13.890228.p1  ORF type:complete len:442 (-),score=98.47 NODE_6957_length_1621_cov_13.890228:150-1475(-)
MLQYLEPAIGALIVCNSISIGLQADPDIAKWRGWIGFEITFCIIFGAEAFLKMGRCGLYTHFCGSDRTWNMFDFMIVLLAVMDIILTETAMSLDFNPNTFTVFRLIRLTRLARLVQLFRIKSMNELALMVKGLFGGMRTLLWALILLLVFVYALGIILVTLVGVSTTREVIHDPPNFEEDMKTLLGSLVRGMVTVFRCLMGDCSTTGGYPLVPMLHDVYGLWFTIPWVGVVILVTFGLFNLIMAIYLEKTLAAAKNMAESEEALDQQNQVAARRINKLVKRFSAAQRTMKLCTTFDRRTFEHVLAQSTSDQLCDFSMKIDRNSFLFAITDGRVNKLMDDLDIESDRAKLFDVIDADGSGALSLSELIRGLLRLRGEATRSDVLAAVLGVDALLDLVRSLEVKVLANQQAITDTVGAVSETIQVLAKASCANTPRVVKLSSL